MTPDTVGTLGKTEDTGTLPEQNVHVDLGAEPKDAKGKKISARNMVRLERRVGIFRRNKEVEPIINQYVEELAPTTKREMKLIERIAALQLQVNQGVSVESNKLIMARLIRRIVGSK